MTPCWRCAKAAISTDRTLENETSEDRMSKIVARRTLLWRSLAVVAGSAAIGLLPVTSGFAQTPTFEQVLAGARAEQAVTIWGSSPGQQQTYKALFEAFNKRFGLDIKGEFVGLNGARARPRIMAESAAGKVSVDMVMGESADGSMLLLRAGNLKPYPWEQVFGKELPGIEKAQFDIPELHGAALPYLDGISVIAYNTTLVKEEDVPDTWAGLADPKYRGKIGLNALLLTPLDQSAYARGVPETFELAKKLLDNHPKLENGSPAVSVAITAGIIPIGIASFHATERAALNGEPQKYKFFKDIIPYSQQCLYVVENSPHPFTARLFAAWFVTEGLKIVNPFEPMPSLRDENSTLAKALKAHLASSHAQIATPKTAKQIDDIMALREQLQTLMTSQSGK
jgi:iron(III) transport system substrate-binding protein